MTGDTFPERGDLSNVLDDLERFDRLLDEKIEENPRGWGGKKISETYAEHGELAKWVNVIPGGSPGGCANTLIVFIGEADDDKDLLYRISAAINHVGVTELCREKTLNVVFYATWWNSRTWAIERRKATSLPKVLWILKTPFAKPQVLG